jgi:hypothetical protein
MAKRPFISKRIDEMEQMFKSSGTELLTLKALENELVHRSRPYERIYHYRNSLVMRRILISLPHSPSPPKWPIPFLRNEQNTFLDCLRSLPKRLNPCR